MRMHRAAPALGAAHAPAATERRNIPHAQLGVLRRSRRPPRSTEARLCPVPCGADPLWVPKQRRPGSTQAVRTGSSRAPRRRTEACGGRGRAGAVRGAPGSAGRAGPGGAGPSRCVSVAWAASKQLPRRPPLTLAGSAAPPRSPQFGSGPVSLTFS
ncbi:hypothetical protein AB1E18_004707 [Capra hircus]